LHYQHNLYVAEKYIVYNFVADITGLFLFIYPLLPSKVAKSREIPIKFDLIAVQGHPRSSILVLVESPHVTPY